MPESAICPDKIRRQENCRGEAMLSKYREGDFVIVPPAVVEGDDAERAIWTFRISNFDFRIYEGGERDDMEVLFQK